MKKFLLMILVVMLVMVMALPVYAVTPPINVPDVPQISDIKFDFNFKISDDFWDKWFNENPVPKPAPLEIPEISMAKYVHKTPYYGVRKHLEIRWNEVDGADSYEVVITKADGTIEEYTVTSNMVYDKNAECPKVYVEETNTWTSATVKVRAVFDGVPGLWSDEINISCDKLH